MDNAKPPKPLSLMTKEERLLWRMQQQELRGRPHPDLVLANLTKIVAQLQADVDEIKKKLGE